MVRPFHLVHHFHVTEKDASSIVRLQQCYSTSPASEPNWKITSAWGLSKVLCQQKATTGDDPPRVAPHTYSYKRCYSIYFHCIDIMQNNVQKQNVLPNQAS